MPNNYLAITIGPIYKMMQYARKTRELWCVSFTFSRLMKHLIDAFMAKGELLSPSNNVIQPLHGAGVFPDRCFFKLNGDFVENKSISNLKLNAFKNFYDDTGICTGLEDYQVYIVQAEINSNPIGTLNGMLDVLELQQRYSQQTSLNWSDYWNPDASKSFFQNLYKTAYDIKDVLPNLLVNNTTFIKRFPSIPEIATNEMAKKSPEKYWGALGYLGIDTNKGTLEFENIDKQLNAEESDDDEIINTIKKTFPEDFLTRHKYFTVVQADGDNVGKLIKAIEKSDGNLKDFSEALNKFASNAAELLVLYGGFPVYIGGDDLLFFAPLANNENIDRFSVKFPHPDGTFGNVFGNNLFFLLSKLNEEFQNELKPLTDLYKDVPAISLSFGVMTGYYKQPLKEIQQEAYDLLFHKAKKQSKKNHIALKVQKHSGANFSLDFTQEGPLYECFLSLSQNVANREFKFLNSLMYKLDDQKKILYKIALDEKRLECFFKENFNEAVHSEYQEFFKRLRFFIKQVFEDYRNIKPELKIEKIYAALRFVHFINAKDVND